MVAFSAQVKFLWKHFSNKQEEKGRFDGIRPHPFISSRGKISNGEEVIVLKIFYSFFI
jgi:hypothetical protein